MSRRILGFKYEAIIFYINGGNILPLNNLLPLLKYFITIQINYYYYSNNIDD